MWIFPENLATFKQIKKVVKKNLEEIFANRIQTLSSENMILNPKACGVQWPYSRTQNNVRTQAFCYEVCRIVIFVFMNHFVYKEFAAYA